ncbi:HpsJ family protein [Nostoc sp. UHCC 0702]|nr:HpsJ family protein [Nostoc sp. UHCC 0702]
MTNRVASVNAPLTLKVVGIILILSFFLDFLILSLPFQPTDRGWQINVVTQLVDRGIVPLLGLAMLFVAYWIDEASDGDRSQAFDLRFPALIIASILGLLFLLFFPLHLNNVNQAKGQVINQINQRANAQENQLKAQLNQLQAQLNTDQGKAQLEQLRNQRKALLTGILQDEQRYKQITENPQAPAELKDLLKKAKANPQELDKAIDRQFDLPTLQNQQLSLIRSQKEQDEKQAKDNAWKSGLRIGISSLLLSIGYIIIGWTGLRSITALKGSGRKAAAR